MLKQKVLELKKATSGITTNPVLDAFNLNECEELDSNYQTDIFIKRKINNCLRKLKAITIDFDENFTHAYNEYNEAITYLELKKKFKTESIPEVKAKTSGSKKNITKINNNRPDFKISRTGELPIELYVEVKALSFLDGNLNYIKAQEKAIDSYISIENQIQQGKKIAIGITEISPFNKNQKDPSRKELIENYISKITNNIKKGQYLLGDTVLLIDIKQLLVGSLWYQTAVPLFVDESVQSVVSGVLWNVIFGKAGHLIYKLIEFEGKSNIDSELRINGILVDFKDIKAVIFATYENQKRKYIGFHRKEETNEAVENMLVDFCDIINDDKNSHAYSIMKYENKR